jgi:hypothetical protein
MEETNPFANYDGSPKEKKLGQYLKWEEEKSDEKLSSMQASLRKKYKKALALLNRRMKA